MLSHIFTSALLLTSIATSAVAAPSAPHGKSANWSPWPACTNETMQVRYDFDSLAPWDRKAYTDAIKCLMDQPSQLDPVQYPGAINRFFDYATIHINRTLTVHLDGYFLVWHRMFLHIFEQDLKNTCGFNGTLPYWNWPATAPNLTAAPIFDGSEYSMSGDGLFVDSGPIQLAPNFSLPHGSGGGCVTTGPFANMNYTMAAIPINVILEGGPLPPTAFLRNDTCLTRDLNEPVATTQTNWTEVDAAIAAPDQATFQVLLNGVFGGTQLGLHSGAHFVMGSPASSIFVSPQDPIWYPLHTMLDLVYVTWQGEHPNIYDQLWGTETAVNLPPSPNVTLSSVTPDFGYLSSGYPIEYLINSQAGPFCYRYDFQQNGLTY